MISNGDVFIVYFSNFFLLSLLNDKNDFTKTIIHLRKTVDTVLITKNNAEMKNIYN